MSGGRNPANLRSDVFRSQKWREQAEEGVAQLGGVTSRVDVGERDFARAAEFGGDDFAHLTGKLAAIGFDVQFEIEPKAASVPVGRTNQDPVTVDDHQLRVVERRLCEPDVTATFEDLPPHRVRGPIDVTQIAPRGQNDIDADAAESGEVQGADEPGIGNEIGRDDLDRCLRLGQSGEQRPADGFEVRVWTVADDTRNNIAALFQFRKPDVAVESFASSEDPVGSESFLQLSDQRALDAEMQIADGTGGILSEHVAVPDVHAAGETDLTVDDENLAMVAEVESCDTPGRKQRRGQEPGGRDFLVRQSVENGRPGVASAGGINQHADFDTALDGAGEGVSELAAGWIVVEDVGGQRNGFLRGIDGGEHGGEGFVTVDERMQLIARRQWLCDDAADDASEHLEVFDAGGLRFAEVGRNRTSGGFVNAENDGAPADAVHTEREVEQGTEEREEPDDTEPETGGARIAFVEQDVNRGEQRGKEMADRDQMRPESERCIKPVYTGLMLRRGTRGASTLGVMEQISGTRGARPSQGGGASDAGGQDNLVALEPAGAVAVETDLKPIVLGVEHGDFGTVVDGYISGRFVERAVMNHGVMGNDDGRRCGMVQPCGHQAGSDHERCDCAEPKEISQRLFPVRAKLDHHQRSEHEPEQNGGQSGPLVYGKGREPALKAGRCEGWTLHLSADKLEVCAHVRVAWRKLFRAVIGGERAAKLAGLEISVAEVEIERGGNGTRFNQLFIRGSGFGKLSLLVEFIGRVEASGNVGCETTRDENEAGQKREGSSATPPGSSDDCWSSHGHIFSSRKSFNNVSSLGTMSASS